MNEAAISPTQKQVAPEYRIRFRVRLAIYLCVWLLAVLAFEGFLRPEGLTETHLSPLQQRLQWPLYTPLMVFFGLGQALSTPSDTPQFYFWICLILFLAHAALSLTRTHLASFSILIGVQTATIAVAVSYFIHFSRLPTGP